MTTTTSRKRRSDDPTSYWTKRLASRAFATGLRGMLEAELRHLAQVPFGELLEPKPIRDLIDTWQPGPAERKHLAALVVSAATAVAEVLRHTEASPQDLLGTRAGDHLMALLLDHDGGAGDDFVAELMQQEFVRRLFTEVIFTSIVSFNKKVNPLFGSFAMRAMEDQIKGFIRLFMPMIQAQAAAFARENRDALHDLARQMAREAMLRPLHEHMRPPTPARRTAAADLLGEALHNDELDALLRSAAHAAWDAIYTTAHKQRLGVLLPIERNAAELATHLSAIVLPILRHPAVVAWLTVEMPAAAGVAPQPVASKAATRRKARPQ